MAESGEPLVLRSVYLPSQMDETLRGLAFQLRLSKSEIIRALVATGIEKIIKDLGRTPDEAKVSQVAKALARGGISDVERSQGKVTMERFRAAVAETGQLVEPR